MRKQIDEQVSLLDRAQRIASFQQHESRHNDRKSNFESKLYGPIVVFVILAQ